MAKPYLSIIIPAYNEAKRIPATLVDIDKKLSAETYSYEIIVVNDGSKDNTAEVVTNFLPIIKNLKLVDNRENKGKGEVVKDGMLAANGNIRLFMDADNTVTISQFNNMVAFFKDYDVVISSRSLKGSQLDPPQPFYKQIMGKLGNLFIQLLVLPGLWDTQCGFKAFKEEAAIKIFSVTKIRHWALDVEVLSLAKHFGFKIKEVPVIWKNDSASHVKLSSYFQVLWETVKIRYWLWTFGKNYGKLNHQNSSS